MRFRELKKLVFSLGALVVLSACGGDNSAPDANSVTAEQTSELSLKRAAFAFLEAVNQRNVAALEQLVREDYIQHNPYIGTGRDAFVDLLPLLEQYGTSVENVRALADGNFVALHNIWNNAEPFGAALMVSFDVLRFDDQGKIAEHWDAIMPNTPLNPSGRSLTDGETQVTDLNLTEENRSKAQELFSTIINGSPEAIGAFITQNFYSNYFQHSPTTGDGVAAVFESFAREQWVYITNHKVIAEGNFVLSISEGTAQGVPAAFYDLLRFDNGRVIEHWDVIQAIPSENLANNNTMFNFN